MFPTFYLEQMWLNIYTASMSNKMIENESRIITTNQCPKGLARNKWPQIYLEPKSPQSTRNPCPPNLPRFLTQNTYPQSFLGINAPQILHGPKSWVKVLEMEPMRSINRKQVFFFMDHCVILWEIPQRQNQYFKRDQNAVNHHTQTSFSLPWNFSQKCTQHENHWTTLLTY